MPNQKQITQSLLIFGFFQTASLLLPIHLHPFRTFYQDALAMLGVILTLCSLAFDPAKNTLRIPTAIVVPFGLIVVIGVQTALGLVLFPVDMIFPVLYLACLALALICGATLAMQEEGLTRLGICLAMSFMVAGFLSVFLQHIQLMNLNWTPYVNPILFNDRPRPYANIAQPNLLALILCFSVASVWFLYLKNYLKPFAALIFTMIFLWGIALTQSRIAWIILPLYVLMCWWPPQDQPKVSKLLLLILLLFYIGTVFFLPHFLTFLGIAGQTVEERASQTSVRLVLWQQAWTMSQLHPLFGVGWFQFGPQQVILSSIFNTAEYSENAHNIVLNFAAEIGWPLTIFLFAGTFYWIYICCIRPWKNTQVRFISLMLMAIAVHSLVEFPLWHGFLLMPFGVMVGALHAEKIGWKLIEISRTWVAALTIASLVLMGAISWDYLRVVEGFVALVAQQKEKDKEYASLDKPEFTLFPQFYDYFRIVKIPVGPKMPQEDIQFLERMSLRFGFMPVLNRLALTYAYNQRPTEALQVLKTIWRLHNASYPKIYADWNGFATQDFGTFGEIVRRLPKPEAQ